MADVRPDPLDSAVRRLSAPAASSPATAPAEADPVLDSLSVIGAALGRPVRRPHPDVEADLPPIAAAAAASGWLGSGVRLTGRWYERLTSPTATRIGGRPAAVLPDDRGADAVLSPDRTVTRIDRGTAALADAEGCSFATDLPATGRWWSLVAWSVRRQRRDVVRFGVLAVVCGLAGLLLPLATGAVFDSAIPSGDLSRVLVILVAFAVASAGAAVLSLAAGMAVVRVRDRMDSSLAPGAMAALLRLPAGFFRARPVGDVVNRALSAEAARAQVDDAVVATVVSSLLSLVSLVYLVSAGAGIALVTALAVAVVIAASVAVQWRARSKSPRLLEARSASTALLLSLLDTQVSWRVAAAEDRALDRWSREQQASTGALRDRLSAIILGPALEVAGPILVLAAFTAAVVAMPGNALVPGTSSAPGTFVAMYAAIIQVTIAMLALGGNLLALSEYGPLLSRMTPVLTAPPERAAPADHPGRLEGRVRLLDVTFGYRADRAPLLRGLSLDVPAGQFLAVVGPSGSGKSTLLRLLLGFEDPWAGLVEYDGHDLARLDPAAVRRQLGTVLQASHPLGRTVRECVAGGRTLDDDRIWALLEQAGLAAEVAAMPEGLLSPVGERGAMLSGGQRQRLMIAAALAVRPRVLLLDEATSALDNLTQAAVMRTVTGLSVTRIVVAHRLSTVRRADRVVVLADGRIVEDGAPDDLLAAGGRFAALAARQEL